MQYINNRNILHKRNTSLTSLMLQPFKSKKIIFFLMVTIYCGYYVLSQIFLYFFIDQSELLKIKCTNDDEEISTNIIIQTMHSTHLRSQFIRQQSIIFRYTIPVFGKYNLISTILYILMLIGTTTIFVFVNIFKAKINDIVYNFYIKECLQKGYVTEEDSVTILNTVQTVAESLPQIIKKIIIVLLLGIFAIFCASANAKAIYNQTHKLIESVKMFLGFDGSTMNDFIKLQELFNNEKYKVMNNKISNTYKSFEKGIDIMNNVAQQYLIDEFTKRIIFVLLILLLIILTIIILLQYSLDILIPNTNKQEEVINDSFKTYLSKISICSNEYKRNMNNKFIQKTNHISNKKSFTKLKTIIINNMSICITISFLLLIGICNIMLFMNLYGEVEPLVKSMYGYNERSSTAIIECLQFVNINVKEISTMREKFIEVCDENLMIIMQNIWVILYGYAVYFTEEKEAEQEESFVDHLETVINGLNCLFTKINPKSGVPGILYKIIQIMDYVLKLKKEITKNVEFDVSNFEVNIDNNEPIDLLEHMKDLAKNIKMEFKGKICNEIYELINILKNNYKMLGNDIENIINKFLTDRDLDMDNIFNNSGSIFPALLISLLVLNNRKVKTFDNSNEGKKKLHEVTEQYKQSFYDTFENIKALNQQYNNGNNEAGENMAPDQKLQTVKDNIFRSKQDNTFFKTEALKTQYLTVESYNPCGLFHEAISGIIKIITEIASGIMDQEDIICEILKSMTSMNFSAFAMSIKDKDKRERVKKHILYISNALSEFVQKKNLNQLCMLLIDKDKQIKIVEEIIVRISFLIATILSSIIYIFIILDIRGLIISFDKLCLLTEIPSFLKGTIQAKNVKSIDFIHIDISEGFIYEVQHEIPRKINIGLDFYIDTTNNQTSIVYKHNNKLYKVIADPSCIITIIGPSGCGKSTLANMLSMQIESKEYIKIYWKDHNNKQHYNTFNEFDPTFIHSHLIKYMPQNPKLNSDDTVYQIIKDNANIDNSHYIFKQYLLKILRDILQLDNILEIKGNDLNNSKIHTSLLELNLSGGQKQRVALAAILIDMYNLMYQQFNIHTLLNTQYNIEDNMLKNPIINTKMFIFDEGYNALSPKAQAYLLEKINKICNMNKSTTSKDIKNNFINMLLFIIAHDDKSLQYSKLLINMHMPEKLITEDGKKIIEHSVAQIGTRDQLKDIVPEANKMPIVNAVPINMEQFQNQLNSYRNTSKSTNYNIPSLTNVSSCLSF